MLKKNKGFTLVELIVTLIVLAIMAFGVVHILTEGFRVWWVNRSFINLRADSRVTLNRIVMEFREAYTGTLNTSTDFSFGADIDNSGDLETVRYYLDGNGNLRRQVNNLPDPGNVICSNITNLTFSWNSPILSIDMTLDQQDNIIKVRTQAEGRCI